MSALDQIEAMLAEIERVDRESGGRFREPDDREAYDIVSRLQRKMRQNVASDDCDVTANTLGGPPVVTKRRELA